MKFTLAFSRVAVGGKFPSNWKEYNALPAKLKRKCQEGGSLEYSDILDLKKRVFDLEEYLLKDPQGAYLYAHYVIHGRWPEAEPIIAQVPEWAYRYAQAVIHGRWPEAEHIIAKNSLWAFYYVLYVIKGRWPEAESVILNSEYKESYKDFVTLKEFPPEI